MTLSDGEVGRELKQEDEDDNDYWIVCLVNAILRYIFLSVADWIARVEKKNHISYSEHFIFMFTDIRW